VGACETARPGGGVAEVDAAIGTSEGGIELPSGDGGPALLSRPSLFSPETERPVIFFFLLFSRCTTSTAATGVGWEARIDLGAGALLDAPLDFLGIASEAVRFTVSAASSSLLAGELLPSSPTVPARDVLTEVT